MRIVIALGGNALLRRGEPMTTDVQRKNVKIAAGAIAPLAAGHSIVVVHGNGPQVGLLSLQAESYAGADPYPLDVLDAGTQGMIGYLIQQELRSLLPPESQVAAWRRVVPSPEPKQILEIQPITWLLERGAVVICAGGGGIPTMLPSSGSGDLVGVEAVIDKDLASELLAEDLAGRGDAGGTGRLRAPGRIDGPQDRGCGPLRGQDRQARRHRIARRHRRDRGRDGRHERRRGKSARRRQSRLLNPQVRRGSAGGRDRSSRTVAGR